MPFLSVLAGQIIVQDNAALSWLYNQFAFNRNQEFTSLRWVLPPSCWWSAHPHSKPLPCIWLTGLHFAAPASLLLTHPAVHQPYEFSHTTRQSSTVMCSQKSTSYKNVYQPVSQLIAQGAVALAMMLLLFIYNPWIALSAAVAILPLRISLPPYANSRYHRHRTRQTANGQRSGL